MTDTPTTDSVIFECHDEGRKVVEPEFCQSMEKFLRKAIPFLKSHSLYGDDLARDIEDFLSKPVAA